MKYLISQWTLKSIDELNLKSTSMVWRLFSCYVHQKVLVSVVDFPKRPIPRRSIDLCTSLCYNSTETSAYYLRQKVKHETNTEFSTIIIYPRQ